MEWMVVLGVALACGIAVFFAIGSRPFRHRVVGVATTGSLLETLMESMQEGSLLVLRPDGSDAFLQFVKPRTVAGNSLGFAFPDAEWSREYWPAVRRELDASEIEYAIVERGDASVPRFIEIEFNDDPIDRSIAVAELVLRAVGIDADSTFTATLEGEVDLAASVAGVGEAFAARKR